MAAGVTAILHYLSGQAEYLRHPDSGDVLAFEPSELAMAVAWWLSEAGYTPGGMVIRGRGSSEFGQPSAWIHQPRSSVRIESREMKHEDLDIARASLPGALVTAIRR